MLMKLTKRILAAVLALVMAIPVILVMPFSASANAVNVTDAAPVKYGLVRTGNSSRGSGDNGCITNDGGDDNMSAILWEFDLTAIHEGYEVTSATLTEDIWSISNKNIPNQYLDFWYCNPADMSNYSNYLNNGNYRDSSLGYGTTGPSTYKAAFGVTESNPLYSSQHVYSADSATISFSNNALVDALNEAAENGWGSIVFVAMYNEPAATTWSDIWAGLPKLSFATTAKPSEAYAKANMASYNGSNLASTSGGIQFSSGGDAYTTNVLYTANGNYDTDYFRITLDDTNRLGFNIYPASSRVVYLNDSDNLVIGYPLVAKVQREQKTNVSVHWGVNYLAIDTANGWSLNGDWHVSSSDRTWDDILSTKSDQAYGVYKINYDENNESNYNADITAQSWGNHASGSHYVDTSYITYRNTIYYNTSAVNFGDNYYYSISGVPTFKASGDGCGHWTGGQGSWNNKDGSGFTINGKTDVDLRVINIKPLKDIVSSADFKSNFNSITANENAYTAESLANYYDIIARIIRFNVNYLDVADDTALASSAAEIKDLVDDYNTYKTPELKTLTVTFKNAAGTTVDERDVLYGNAVGDLPANTTGSVHNAGTNTHNGYTWEGVVTAETVITDNAEFTETTKTVNCTFADVYTEATDAMNGYTTYTCACGNSYSEYDALDFTAYNAAVADYETTINGADYANYTDESKAAYEAAVAAAKLTAAQLADETLAPAKITAATNAIIAANELLEVPEAHNSYNLTIEDNVEVNFNIDTDFYEAQGGTIEYSYLTTTDDKSAERTSTTVNVDDIEDAAGISAITIEAAPAQIAEPYVITVRDSNGDVKDTITTSIQAYCQTIMNPNNGFGENDVAVAKALLNYGALANEYFGYAEVSEAVTGDAYTVAHTDDWKDAVDAESFKAKAKCSVVPGTDASGEAVYVTGISYLALLDPEFRFYVSQTNEVLAAKTEVSVDVAGLQAEMVKTANGNCVRVTGLKASDFGKTFTVTIGTYEITYNGYAFLYTALRNESTLDTGMKDLAKGVYRYAAACEAKFA
jgi:hypothetical protein